MYGKDVVQVLMQSIDKLATSHEKTNDKVDKLIEAMSKQDVILERLANIESRHSDSINRVHKAVDTKDSLMGARVTSLELLCSTNTEELLRRKSLEDRFITVEKKVEKLDFAVVLFKYPKLFISLAVIAYIIAIKDIRDILLQAIGIL